nr:hypothetical protein LOC_Os11g45580 [Oryza sativa Japonica Group]
MECQLKKYLVLLATLVATVTYAAGLNPPGGSWLEDGGGGGRWQLAGDAILQDTNYWRYIVFYWFNAISFAASLVVVSLLFLLLHKGRPPPAPGDQAAHAHPGAGLNPPGGFWRSTEAAGDPVLPGLHPIRYKFFFFSNAISFIASLLAITFNVYYEKLDLKRIKFPLYGLTVTAILGLGGAYAAGSCRDSRHTGYVLGLIVPVLVCIFLQWFLVGSNAISLPFGTRGSKQYNNDLDKPCELIQLLAILAAIVAYQAGIDPPGGVWADNGASHSGDPILLTTHPRRYKVFFYFNSVAFVASLVIMVMLQNEFLVRSHVLEAAMILDLFCLIGAYAVGSCRDTSTSIYTVALAGGVLIYVVIHILFSTLEKKSDKQGEEDKIKEHQLEKKRELLLLVEILAATLTYQAGLTPPGGFWENDEFGHRAGFPVLLDKFPIRYKAFFYCNAASFMASVALIILLLNRNLYGPGIKCYALFVCMVAGMFGLIDAYAAGSSMHLRTSIVVLILVTVVFAAVVYVAIIGRGQRANINQHQSKQTQNQQTNKEDGMMDTPRQTQDQQEADMKKKADMMAKYLMLAGILAASVAYLTGLKPPGGLWRDEGNGHSAGNPVLYDIDKRRYNAFFYSNSTSFMASITVIVLLLRRMTKGDEHKLPLWPMHTAMLLDMLALLGAYAAGSTRNWCTFKDAILLLLPVLGFVVILFFWKKGGEEKHDGSK